MNAPTIPIASLEIPLACADGHRYMLLARMPARADGALLWLPALGVAARHYLPLAEALAARGIAVFVHEWRGNGSSSLRASRRQDWGYRELLEQDLPVSHAEVRRHAPAGTHMIGGHSLGGQLAACYLGQHPQGFARLWLVGSGTPHWRSFPAPRGWALPFFYQFAPWLADWRGAFPGRRLGFGGDEARGLIRDWARVGLSGRYRAAGWDVDLEAGMRQVTATSRGVLFDDDWLAPASSLRALLAKLPNSPHDVTVLHHAALGTRADHFAWMKQPQAVIDAFLA
ncbi:alpha/beta hydrolase family protein [Pseudoxanthomonas putridarboris]|uniref:Alpha/beta fold hydrolase n=1 Tax=Pseudoxanthomonas putridarboris TaxID=752605 RepID=A0ABU9IYE4_9GAMM